MKSKLTPKQKVLRKFPKAHIYEHAIEFLIYPDHGLPYLSYIGAGTSQKEAWTDAAKNLK